MVSDPTDVHDLSGHQLHLGVVAGQRHGAARGADHGLAVEEDGPRVLGSDDADVGKCNGATLDVVESQLTCLRRCSQAHQLLLDLDHVLAAHILDVGDHESVRRVHRHGDVVRSVDGVAGRIRLRGPELGVHLRVVVEGQGDGLQHEGGHRNLGPVLLQGIVLQLLLQGQHVGHVNLLPQCHVGHHQGRLHGLDHALANVVGDLNHLILQDTRGGHGKGRRGGACAGAGRTGRTEILLKHAAIRPCSLHGVQVDAELLRKAAHLRGRQNARSSLASRSSFRRRRRDRGWGRDWGCGWGRRWGCGRGCGGCWRG
mmetsp:Transcript_38760/g.92605  ORF Transcript_38760/g.92605 Transcript_38760/m.92605 type:complete len:313 (-) Transcript_38760:809-1747(-)